MKKLNLMSRVKLTGAIAFLACLFFLAGVANASIFLYNNLGFPSDGVDPVAETWTDQYNTVQSPPLFDSFSSGPADTTLLDVQLRLRRDLPTFGSISVALYNDSGNPLPSPGTMLGDPLGTIDDTSLSSDFSVVDVFTSRHLDANTRYWIELSSTDGSSAVWSWSFDQSGIGVAGEYFGHDGSVLPNIYGPYQMVVITPLPGAVWLLGSGLAGLGLWRGRKFFKA